MKVNPVMQTVSDSFSPSHFSFNDFSFLKSKDEEFELVSDWQKKGDRRALNRLVSSHKKLVEKIAYGYKGYGLCMEELIAEGYVGMMQAVEKFEPEKGFRLSTYATWWIKSAMQDYIFNSWSMVKLSKGKGSRKLFFGLRSHKAKHGYDDYLTTDQANDIAAKLDVTPKEVYEMNDRIKGSDFSLSAPVSMGDGEESGQWQDWIPDEKNNLEDNLAQSDESLKIKKIVHKALEILSSREHHILMERRFKEPPSTLESLAQQMNISKERIRQIENKAYDKIHDKIKHCVNPAHFFRHD